MTRVVRGGSWNNNQNNARAAYRNRNNPNNRNNNIGFRVCCLLRPTPLSPCDGWRRCRLVCASERGRVLAQRPASRNAHRRGSLA